MSNAYAVDAGPVHSGGRNLLRGTSDEWTEYTIRSWGDTMYTILMDGNPDLEIGDTITLQVDVDYINSGGNDNNTVFARIFFYAPDGSYTGGANSEHVRVGEKAHFVIPDLAIPENTVRFIIVLAHDVAAAPVLRYRRFMLSKGAAIIDWQPAPEDKEDAIKKFNVTLPVASWTQVANELAFSQSVSNANFLDGDYNYYIDVNGAYMNKTGVTISSGKMDVKVVIAPTTNVTWEIVRVPISEV